MNSKTEKRCAEITELRVAESEGSLPIIEGHAAVFDSLSQELGRMFPFKEKIQRGAFKDSLEKDDIRALWNHDPNYVLGRNRANTLELSESEKGLKVRIQPPDTAWARDLVTSIKRGDISQMSFGFTVEKEDWTVENGEDIRTLRQVKLFDVSPVTFPAYLQTDVGVRAMDSYKQHKADQERQTKEKEQRKAEFELLKSKFKKSEDTENNE